MVFFLLTISTSAQNTHLVDGTINFEEIVDYDAEPTDSIKNFSSWFMSNMNSIDNDCLDVDGVFYFDIYILSNGRVTKWTLIQEELCIIAEVNVWNIPFWVPARKDGKPCSQHLRIRTNIHLD